MSLSNPIIIALLTSIIIALFLYAFIVPRNVDEYSPNTTSGETTRKNLGLSLTTKLGSEIYATLPAGVTYKSNKSDERIESLITRSGNPWNFSNADEFKFFRIATASAGFILGWGIWALLSNALSIPAYIIVPITTFFGFLAPKIKYNDYAKKRDLEFKRQLPEALDLIIISLSGGATFPNAIRASIPNMKDGVLKEEFRAISKQMDTGKTADEALQYFAGRAPNESIRTFIQSVREASQLNVPLVDVLQSRAEASREEFFALIHARIASLESKMVLVLGPTLVPALLIILTLPSLSTFATDFTG